MEDNKTKTEKDTEKEEDVKEEESKDKDTEIKDKDSDTDSKTPMIKMWFAAPIAFLILVSVILFIFFSRGDFNRDQVFITIDAPPTIEGGTEELIEVVLDNNSNTDIQNVRIAFYVPEELLLEDGTRSKIVELDVLSSGDEHRIPMKISAISTGASVELDARVDYSPKDINARFADVMKQEILIGSLSVDVEIDIPDEIYSVESVNGAITISPRASFDKESLYARILSIDGFEIKASVPDFSKEESWKLDQLVEGENQKIEFSGMWEGVTDNFVLEFEIGKYDGLDFVPLFKKDKKITITSSPLVMNINKRGDDSKVKPDSEVVLDIVIQNQGDKGLNDIKLNAELPEPFVNIRTATGGYGSRLNGNIISWSYEHMKILEYIAPQDEAEISLRFNVKDIDSSESAKRPSLTIVFNSEAKIDNRGVLYQSTEKNLEITGEPKFVQTVTRESKNFPAEGPFPLKVGEETSFVVRWRVKNSVNELNNIQVHTILPSHIDYGGTTHPVSNDIFYDDNKKKIVWEIDKLKPFDTKEISYVIWAVPRSSQEGSYVELIGSSTFNAFDAVNKDFSDKKLPSVNSSLPDDNQVDDDGGLVEF